MPYPLPHRELAYTRGMYMRSEKFMVQTPDFEAFSNLIVDVVSRNDLIFKVKQVSHERGFKTKISLASTAESKS